MAEGFIVRRGGKEKVLSFAPVVATGGNVSDVNVEGFNFRQHTFTDVGTHNFEVQSFGSEGIVQVLVVGGGGGGGFNCGGGGGAGGVVFSENFKLSEINNKVKVGNGGQGGVEGVQEIPKNGTPSIFNNLIALGGATNLFQGTNDIDYGIFGGSGCGETVNFAGQKFNNAIIGLQGLSNNGFGNNGGNSAGTGSNRASGGGGGAGSNGQNATSSSGGDGGSGLTIFSLNVAGGGGGGVRSTSNNGIGTFGGGNGGRSNTNGTNGTPNTGGGGGGGGGDGGSRSGGDGGSGIVVIRYPLEEVA